ncbi:MAG TPA: hydroxyisourate hydrolase [Gemmatimonadales bacterium]|nr:hydroxyisourate hydrolase [Gemmatimonadales bacterium]
MPNTNRPTISTHVLDTTRGEPAAGVAVLLFRLEAHERTLLGTRETDADGRIGDVGGPLAPGLYGLSFEVAAYYGKQGQSPFVQRVTVDFEITGARARYHIPLLMSPFSCTTYRGS